MTEKYLIAAESLALIFQKYREMYGVEIPTELIDGVRKSLRQSDLEKCCLGR